MPRRTQPSQPPPPRRWEADEDAAAIQHLQPGPLSWGSDDDEDDEDDEEE